MANASIIAIRSAFALYSNVATVDLKIEIYFKTNALEHNLITNVLVDNLGVIHDLADGLHAGARPGAGL